MRRLIPYFFLLVSAVAAPSPDPASREAALDRLTSEARRTRLLDQSAQDITNHRYRQALEKADEILGQDPSNPIALNTRGAALTELKRYDEASKALDAAIAAEPTAFAPRFNVGEILSLQKKYVEAAEHFSALQTRFGSAPILKYKVYLCYALADKKDKAADLLGAMRYPADGAAWYFAYAVDRLKSGRVGEAKQLIAAAQAIHPKDSGTFRDTLVESGLLK